MRKGACRMLPIYGRGTQPVFPWVEPFVQAPRANVLYGVGDNTTAKQLRSAFNAQAFALFEGTYHNFLALYSSVSRQLERQAARQIGITNDLPSSSRWREWYFLHKSLLQSRARQLDRFMLAVDSDGRHTPGVVRSPHHSNDSPLARVVRSALTRASADRPGETFDGVLLGSHSYMTLKSAAQYEIRGVPIPQLGNQRIKVRYNVFPPTRKDYLALFSEALQRGSVHYVDPGDMRQCLEVGTGTGVLSFILNAHGAQRVIGVDINEDAVLNAKENRDLLGTNGGEIDFVQADLFPGTAGTTKYDLIVSNPPWIPMIAERSEDPHNAETDGLMGGVLDRSGDMLPELFRGVRDRLSSRGRFWLVYSDIAVKLGLQDAAWLKDLCDACGLRVRAQTSAPARVRLRPQDPFYGLKREEVLTLYDIVPKEA